MSEVEIIPPSREIAKPMRPLTPFEMACILIGKVIVYACAPVAMHRPRDSWPVYNNLTITPECQWGDDGGRNLP